MVENDSGYGMPRNRIVVAVAIIFLSIVASIAFRNYTIAFLGIVVTLLYLVVVIYADNSRKTTDALVAVLAKLNGKNTSNNAQLREVEVNGVMIKVSDEDYIKILEAEKKS